MGVYEALCYAFLQELIENNLFDFDALVKKHFLKNPHISRLKKLYNDICGDKK